MTGRTSVRPPSERYDDTHRLGTARFPFRLGPNRRRRLGAQTSDTVPGWEPGIPRRMWGTSPIVGRWERRYVESPRKALMASSTDGFNRSSKHAGVSAAGELTGRSVRSPT